MAGNKYRFDPESLSLSRHRLGFRGLILKVIKYFLAGAVISVAFYIVFSRFFDSPKERILRRENELLKLQYEVMEKKLDQVSVVLAGLQQRDDNIYRTIFEADPISNSVREAGIGGVNRYSDLEGYESSDLVISTAKKLDKVLKKAYIQDKSYEQIIPLALNLEILKAAMPAIQPVANKNLERTSSGFGYRIDPFLKIRKLHEGLDFAAPIGTDIYATGDGVVEKASNSMNGYGNCVIVDHGFGYKTLYAHMSAFKVKVGQKVKRGELIGLTGNTGLSSGPHLHYEVIKENVKVNPISYFNLELTPDQYDQITSISNNTGQSLD
jgi:murein DD-endopeptidase MepM/ murein hydrolase activator NlpD